MASVEVHNDVELDAPLLVEGLPGVGIVGKIAADYLVDALDMTPYAAVHCDGLPRVAVYGQADGTIRAPVRIYADEANELLVLQSDVPVSSSGANEFAACVTGWMERADVTPIFQSGRPTENNTDPSIVGIATGDGGRLLDEVDIDRPTENGAVSGPTGALLYEAGRSGLDGVGLIVDEAVLPGDTGAVTLRATLLDDGGALQNAELALYFALSDTAENGLTEPEREAGDD